MADGISPVPREARAYQGEPAGLITRLAAGTVDAVTMMVAALGVFLGANAFSFIVDPHGFELITVSTALGLTFVLVACVLYLAASWSLTGRTYGDHVMGLRVVGARGGKVHVSKALVRAVLCVAFPLGLLWSVASSRRSVQDAFLRTAVVYDWLPRRDGRSTLSSSLRTSASTTSRPRELHRWHPRPGDDLGGPNR
jgi:uncharacterized RDD family membrane protein YckC